MQNDYSSYTNSNKTNVISVWKIRSPAYFGQQRFGQQLQNKWNTVFFTHVNMVASGKRKRSLPFNHEVFYAVSAKCKGQNSKHEHAAWGLDKKKKKFATSEETAYPMGLAKLLANCIAMALIDLGIKAPEETISQLKPTSLKSLQQMKAATGVQPKASRIPPLVPTFKARIRLQAMATVLPVFQLYQKCRDDIKLDAPGSQILPKGSKLLAIQPAKTSADKGGSDQSLPPPIVLGKTDDVDDNLQLVQTWGSPWSPMEFIQEAVKAGHPSQKLPLDACLPFRLKLLAQKFRVTSLRQVGLTEV